jgi:glycosyltransferase involved in cell wall biosynthesis
MSFFDVVFWYRAKGVLPNDGLIVLLSDLVRHSSPNGVKTRILVSSRHRDGLLRALKVNGVDLDSIHVRSFDVAPAFLQLASIMYERRSRVGSSSILSKLKRRTKWRLARWGRGLSSVVASVTLPTAIVASILLLPIAAAFVVLGVLCCLVAAPFLITGMIVAKLRHKTEIIKRLPGARRAKRYVEGFSRHTADLSFSTEARRLGKAISSLKDVQAVYAPFAFCGEVLQNVKQPKLVVFPDLVPWEYPTRFAGHYRFEEKKYISLAVQSADALVCYSQHVADQQLRKYFEREVHGKPVHVIPQGFFNDPKQPSGSASARFKFKNEFSHYCSYIPDYDLAEIDYVVYPSVDRSHKNTITLVRAVEWLVRRKHRNLKVVSTTHWLSPELRDFITDRKFFLDCLFAPSLPEAELKVLIRHAKLVVHPSLAEGGDVFNFSRGVSAGVPSLLSDIPMVREMFDRYGISQSVYGRWLFDPRNYMALADLIDESIFHREALIQEQAHVLKQLESYDFGAMAERYFAAYRTLIREQVEHV